VLSNHDVVRHVTRYGRSVEDQNSRLPDIPTDEALGRRRARAAALLSFALPGGVYIYQGDELGLPWVELPVEVLQCPHWERSGHTRKGRDGCRVPIPWSGKHSPHGFGPEGSTPWLPMPASWAELSVARQSEDPTSHLALYRRALQLRREHPALGDGSMRWLESEPHVLSFRREPGFTCLLNLGAEPIELPQGHEVLLSSSALVGDRLPTDAAAWLVEQ
jgi:alpha-glucosidase